MDLGKFKKPLLITGIIAAIGTLSVLALVIVGVAFIVLAKDLPLTDHDRGLIVTAETIAPYYDDFEPSPEFEIIAKKRYLDFSKEITYEYDSPRDYEPYISVTISHERKLSDAAMVFGIEWSAQKLGLNIYDQDFELAEQTNFYQVGDKSKFGHIMLNDEILGHVLVARKGNSIYAFSMSGFILDDPEIWHELFDDRINRLSSQTK